MQTVLLGVLAVIAGAGVIACARFAILRRTAERVARESERRLQLLLAQVPAVLWTVDRDLTITSVLGNEQIKELSREARDGALRALCGEEVRFELQVNGRWMQHEIDPMRDEAGSLVGAVGVQLDITEIRQNAERFKHLAREDALTGLPNRLALQERLPAVLAQALERGDSVAVLFIDVDRFKTINDTLGHRIGDELLKAVSNRFQQHLPQNATVYRPGGDEFIVVVERIKHKRTVATVSMEVISVFADPFELEGRELFVTGSVGASIYPKNADTADDLIAFADSAMYRAKEAGGNNAKFYDGTMHAHVLERLGLEQDLRQALSRNEMRVAYQPIVDVMTRRIMAAEALIRWEHPLLGELHPQAFIEIAEETGVIVELSRWVLRDACWSAVRARGSGYPEFRVAVNMSARDFYEPDFPSALNSILAETGLPAEALDLEITENVALNDMAINTLARVHAMGVGIVVDDFGTGYSSLGYIKRLPVSAIKIDKSFIDDVTHDPFDRGIVKAITTLAQTLNLRVIAEGIESEAQWQFVRGLNCGQAQGYFFQRPVEWAEVAAMLPRGLDADRGRVVTLFR